MEQVTSLVTGHILTILIAVVVVIALSLVAGRILGKNDRRKRRAATNLTFYGGMIVFALLFLPQLLGARG